MKAVVKKPFDYSPDGISIVRLTDGETHDIADSVFPGLVEAGLVEPEADKEKSEKTAQSAADSNAPKSAHVARRAPISPASKG
jgi:hypothetical protein